MRRPRYCRRRRGSHTYYGRGGRPSNMIVAYNPHSMSPCSDEFGDCPGERGAGVDGKDGDLVLAVTDSLFEFYDGEEVGAGGTEEVGGGGAGDVLDVDHGDVSYKTLLVVDDGDGGYTAGGHCLESSKDMGVGVHGNDVCGPDSQLSNLP